MKRATCCPSRLPCFAPAPFACGLFMNRATHWTSASCFSPAHTRPLGSQLGGPSVRPNELARRLVRVISWRPINQAGSHLPFVRPSERAACTVPFTAGRSAVVIIKAAGPFVSRSCSPPPLTPPLFFQQNNRGPSGCPAAWSENNKAFCLAPSSCLKRAAQQPCACSPFASLAGKSNSSQAGAIADCARRVGSSDLMFYARRLEYALVCLFVRSLACSPACCGRPA